jgi:hypothetical protein
MLKKLLKKRSDLARKRDEAQKRLDDLDGRIEALVGPAAMETRVQAGKDTGAVTFEYDGVRVTVTVPKVVSWNEDLLQRIAQGLQAAGEDPAQYIRFRYSVPENAYTHWPDSIRRVFEPARVMVPGRPKYAFKEVGHA